MPGLIGIKFRISLKRKNVRGRFDKSVTYWLLKLYTVDYKRMKGETGEPREKQERTALPHGLYPTGLCEPVTISKKKNLQVCVSI